MECTGPIRLVVQGNNAAFGSYTPGITNDNGLDGSPDYRGTLVVGGTTIQFQEFERASSVTVRDVANFTVTAPLAGDRLFVNKTSDGETRIYGWTGGVPIVPLNVDVVRNLTVDTAPTDASGPGNDNVRVITVADDFRGQLTIDTGTGRR